MSFKQKLKSMRKPYGNRQTGTYQTRDTGCNQHVSSPKVVHEEVTPPAPDNGRGHIEPGGMTINEARRMFEPLLNHQGAPVQNPVEAPQTEDENEEPIQYTVKLSLTEKEENALRVCLYVCVGVILLTALASLFMWIVSML